MRFLFLSVTIALLLLISGSSTFAQDDDPFRVALTGKYPPFSFYANDGTLAGFDVDVSTEVARRMGMEPEIITTEWDGILPGLLSGRYDAIIGSMAITPERQERVDFSDPYYISGAQLFVDQVDAEEIQSIDDMAGKTIGVVLGTTYEHYISSNHPDVKILTYKGDVDMFQEMRNQRLDGFVTDKLVGMFQIKEAGMGFVPAGDLIYEERIAIPVQKNRTDLLTGINTAIGEMNADGTFESLHKKWFRSDASDASTPSMSGMSNTVIAAKLFKGFLITLQVAFASLLIGFLLALPLGMVLNGKANWTRFIVRAVVDFIRGTPVLIQLFFVYFGAPQIGIHLSPIAAAILTLSVNSAAYMAEVIRSGLMAVDPGQAIAGRALGLTKTQVFRHVIWPQAFRVATPSLMNSAVALLKDTALISVISVAEVLREAQSIISVTFDPIRFYFIVGLMFFLFTFPLMKLAGVMEERMKRKGFKNA